MNPIILTTAGIENTSRGLIQNYCYKTYSEAIANSGGIPLIVSDDRNLEQLADMADGLFLTGGDDMNSFFYNGDPQYCLTPDTWRDHLEIKLARLFFARNKPIFGVCRGMQLLNVAFGGTLFEDLKVRCGLDHPNQVAHMVHAQPGTRFANWYGEYFMVNSFHHQAIDKLGEGLFVTIHTLDGIIEAIEHETLPIFGTQWHPERMTGENRFSPEGPDMKLMFDHFCEICSTWNKKDKATDKVEE